EFLRAGERQQRRCGKAGGGRAASSEGHARSLVKSIRAERARGATPPVGEDAVVDLHWRERCSPIKRRKTPNNGTRNTVQRRTAERRGLGGKGRICCSPGRDDSSGAPPLSIHAPNNLFLGCGGGISPP